MCISTGFCKNLSKPIKLRPEECYHRQFRDKHRGKFYGCDVMSFSVQAKATPTMADNALFGYGATTLYVPQLSLHQYKTTELWKKFSSITIKGDANNDGVVNADDVTEPANAIVHKPSCKYVFNSADMNGYGVVDIQDLTQLVNLLTEK